jgi:hypothetical protein
MDAIGKFYELAERIGLNVNYWMGYSVAAKFVESFEKHIKSSQWIRPQDQMPKRGEPVLITDNEGLQIVAWYAYGEDMWYSENHSWFPREVNYWMPIPEIV